MTILTQGADLSLAPTITPLIKPAGKSLASGLSWLAREGFHAVQLDATLSGIRPRELNHRARRDLISLLTRSSVRLGGLDFFIPRRHYLDEAEVDRAVTSTLATIELAADLGRAPVSISLPVAELSEDIKHALVEAADGRGVTLAVYGSLEDQGASRGESAAVNAWVDAVDLPALGAGLDPVDVIAAGGDAVAVCHRLASRLASARLGDGKSTAGREDGGAAMRCGIGEGELDLLSYRLALDLAWGGMDLRGDGGAVSTAPSRQKARGKARGGGPVVLDLRGLAEPMKQAAAARRAWDRAAFAV